MDYLFEHLALLWNIAIGKGFYTWDEPWIYIGSIRRYNGI